MRSFAPPVDYFGEPQPVGTGLQFTASCTCGGELSLLTRSRPDETTVSARVVCRSCGTQWVIDAFLNPLATWSQESAREATHDGLYVLTSKGSAV